MSSSEKPGEQDSAKRVDGRAPEESRAEETNGRRPAEWVTLAVSLLIVSVLMGAALYEHFMNDEPSGVHIQVAVDVDHAESRDGQSYIPFSVTNTGREPAEQVVIQFDLTDTSGSVEESTVEIPILPSGGVSHGEIITTQEITDVTIDARAVNFLEP